ncbi:MAG TPA: hypothetical protein VKI43_19175 [Vicinamibacterales bacterium]|nr:hypothetical protein [Vicinamibacterales bacterium]
MADDTNTLPERVQVVEEKLDRLSESVDQRFDAADKRFDAVDAAFLEQRQYTEFAYSRLETKMDARFDRVDGRLDHLDGRLDRVDRKLDQLSISGALGAFASRAADAPALLHTLIVTTLPANVAGNCRSGDDAGP